MSHHKPTFVILHTLYVNIFLITALQNTRVGKKVEVVLEIKDENSRMLKNSGNFVSVELLQRNTGILESCNLDIVDNKNGTYNISFLPEVTGKYALHIRIQGQRIEVSLRIK